MRRRKTNFENLLAHAGNWTRVTLVKCQSADHYTMQTLLSGVDFKKVYYVYDKSYNFTNPSLLQIEMIDIGHKSLPIIIEPYSRHRISIRSCLQINRPWCFYVFFWFKKKHFSKYVASEINPLVKNVVTLNYIH